MAVLKNSDIKKMSSKEKEKKIIQLKIELIKGSTPANKTNAKSKEIKKAISRILTSIKLNSPEEKLEKTK